MNSNAKKKRLFIIISDFNSNNKILLKSKISIITKHVKIIDAL